jgi:hypothetical protein
VKSPARNRTSTGDPRTTKETGTLPPCLALLENKEALRNYEYETPVGQGEATAATVGASPVSASNGWAANASGDLVVEGLPVGKGSFHLSRRSADQKGVNSRSTMGEALARDEVDDGKK